MKKIAVICALPPEKNTGMATVDLSAFVNIPPICPSSQITLYTYGKPNKWAYQQGELPFYPIDMTDYEDSYFSSDLFIFWGDFVHSHSYWKYDKVMWDGDHQEHSSYQKFSKFMFLSELPIERLKNVIVFGSTVITNDVEDEIDPLYNTNFNRFFGNIGAVFFRDALSAAKISPFQVQTPTLSCDCALLLQNDDLSLLKGFVQNQNQDGIGVFFGRSPYKLLMIFFAQLLGILTGQHVKWIPWFFHLRRFRWLVRLCGIKIPSDHFAPGDLLSQVSGCRFIVTDTYHLCVNSWQLGIPAICIGQGAEQQSNSLGDKKKEILYNMYGAQQYYVFLESLKSPINFFKESKRIQSLLDKKELSDRVVFNILKHKETALARLALAVKTFCR